jgi:hypothetical protein
MSVINPSALQASIVRKATISCAALDFVNEIRGVSLAWNAVMRFGKY